MNRISILILFLAVLNSAAFAVSPDEQLSDPVLEQRARIISKNLRCVVCQNQSIDDSDASLAADMRKLVRRRVLAGDSNQEVTDFMVARYGNFVLLRPPFIQSTWVLWFAPLGFILIGGGLFYISARRKNIVPEQDDPADPRITDILNQFRK